MKRIIYFIIIISAGMFFHSCDEDLLDKTPKDEISDPDFWTTEGDLKLYLNSLYSVLPSWTGGGGGADPCEDIGTDIVIEDPNWWGFSYTPQLDGTLTVPASGGGWNWSNVRRVNYFLENADRAEIGDLIDHYIGEGYFFRAFIYFDLLKQFGDLPIVKEVPNVGDKDILYSSRRPRTEVIDFILEDLDEAISRLESSTVAGPNRVHKDVAKQFKARVCLYEGTWEKYHEGTDFAGSTDGTAYLEEAAAQALDLINSGNYSLSTGNPDQAYYELFVQMDLSSNPEVLLWRDYDALGLGVANTIWNWPNNQGMTREMLQKYLCVDGLPTAVSGLYRGDSLSVVEVNRDPRLENTIMVPGELDYVALEGDSVDFITPDMSVNGCPTGYEFEKWRTHWLEPAQNSRTRDVPFIQFRYAEALLIYAEAKAELGTLNQNDVDMTINKLRDRVGMPHLVLGSITPDPNWPDYGYSLPDDYLYEIRRERVVELFGEGFRFDDLMRWRAHNLFVDKRPVGAPFTGVIKEEFPNKVVNAEGYLDPFKDFLNNGAYGFDPDRDYLLPLPTNELTINDKLEQNPKW